MTTNTSSRPICRTRLYEDSCTCHYGSTMILVVIVEAPTVWSELGASKPGKRAVQALASLQLVLRRAGKEETGRSPATRSSRGIATRCPATSTYLNQGSSTNQGQAPGTALFSSFKRLTGHEVVRGSKLQFRRLSQARTRISIELGVVGGTETGGAEFHSSSSVRLHKIIGYSMSRHGCRGAELEQLAEFPRKFEETLLATCSTTSTRQSNSYVEPRSCTSPPRPSTNLRSTYPNAMITTTATMNILISQLFLSLLLSFSSSSLTLPLLFPRWQEFSSCCFFAHSKSSYQNPWQALRKPQSEIGRPYPPLYVYG